MTNTIFSSGTPWSTRTCTATIRNRESVTAYQECLGTCLGNFWLQRHREWRQMGLPNTYWGPLRHYSSTKHDVSIQYSSKRNVGLSPNKAGSQWIVNVGPLTLRYSLGGRVSKHCHDFRCALAISDSVVRAPQFGHWTGSATGQYDSLEEHVLSLFQKQRQHEELQRIFKSVKMVFQNYSKCQSRLGAGHQSVQRSDRRWRALRHLLTTALVSPVACKPWYFFPVGVSTTNSLK